MLFECSPGWVTLGALCSDVGTHFKCEMGSEKSEQDNEETPASHVM